MRSYSHTLNIIGSIENCNRLKKGTRERKGKIKTPKIQRKIIRWNVFILFSKDETIIFNYTQWV